LCQFLSNLFSQKAPNVLWIFADDLGYADLGCQGSQDIKTPNIDQLTKNGVIMTQAYSSCSVCSTSSAGLISRRYQSRFGHEYNWPIDQIKPHFGLPQSFILSFEYKLTAETQ
jgi:arylsulfatase A-like enzyme